MKKFSLKSLVVLGFAVSLVALFLQGIPFLSSAISGLHSDGSAKATNVALEAISAESWEYAAKSAPPGLMQQALEDNLEPGAPVDPGRMKVLTIEQPDQKAPLYLIDTKVQYGPCPPQGCSQFANPLCGSAGCAYLGYVREGSGYRLVFKEWLSTALPPDDGVPWLQVSKSLRQGFPCLVFAEYSKNPKDPFDLEPSLRASQFCYDGKAYKPYPSSRS